jgi:hypothetical protein
MAAFEVAKYGAGFGWRLRVNMHPFRKVIPNDTIMVHNGVI